MSDYVEVFLTKVFTVGIMNSMYIKGGISLHDRFLWRLL